MKEKFTKEYVDYKFNWKENKQEKRKFFGYMLLAMVVSIMFLIVVMSKPKSQIKGFDYIERPYK